MINVFNRNKKNPFEQNLVDSKVFCMQKLTSQKLTESVSFWAQKLTLWARDTILLSGVCMIDQSAAYDLLCHENYAKKLKLYNFDEASVNWCKSYLGGRTQCVQVE